MFPDLSWSHMLLVLVVALVVVGPKDLPKLMHTIGRWAGKARAMADQFRKSFDDMARQSELDELRKELDDLRNMRPLAETERTVAESLRPPDVSVAPEAKPETAEPSEVVHEAKPQAVEPSEPIGEGHELRAP